MDDIGLMLSDSVQQYYGDQYYSFQQVVVDRNPLLVADREKITACLSQAALHGDVIDIGAGDCQWFSGIEASIQNYYALDVSEAALSRCPESPKLHKMVSNGFDVKFPLNQLSNNKPKSALFSFFLSHFSDQTIGNLLEKIQFVDTIIIIDSYWTDIQKGRHKTKDLQLVHRKTSAQSQIQLPKRFFTESVLAQLTGKINFEIQHLYTGNYWFCCVTKRKTALPIE